MAGAPRHVLVRINMIMSYKIGRNAPCWCGSNVKYKNCHEAFDAKLKRYRLLGHEVPGHNLLKTKDQIERIKESAIVNRACLDAVGEVICAGMSTEDIDRIVYETTTKMGAIPAPLNYEGFPKSVCTSINEVVCHGIPSKDVILKDGDIINVDCSTILNGYFSDSSRMYMIGNVSEEKQKLVRVTKECCDLGLKEVKPWGHLGDIAQVINDHATKNGYSVVREIGGHGVGLEFHEDPWVSYVIKAGTGMLLVPGLMFTIEPMINMGTHAFNTSKVDGWTVTTADGKPSAQWEYQVVVTEDGVEMISW